MDQLFIPYERNKYMLFAGWEVCMVKNCDRGLENTARGRTEKYYSLSSTIHSCTKIYLCSLSKRRGK